VATGIVCAAGGWFAPAQEARTTRQEKVLHRIVAAAIAATILSLPALAQAPKAPRETIHIGIIDRTFFYWPADCCHASTPYAPGYLRARR